MFGDDDEVILEHAIVLYRVLPDAELAVIPGPSHSRLVEKPELCNTMIIDFLTNDPVPTFAPIRRVSTRCVSQTRLGPTRRHDLGGCGSSGRDR
jgi:hypothetical protein